MIKDIDQLFLEQAWIDGMQDAADASRPVPADQMVRMVHCDGGDPVALLHTETLHCLREFPRFDTNFGPVAARDRAVCPIADYLAYTMLAGGMIDQIGDLERSRLHCTGHIFSPNN